MRGCRCERRDCDTCRGRAYQRERAKKKREAAPNRLEFAEWAKKREETWRK